MLKIIISNCSDCSKDDSWNSIIGGDIQIVEFQKWRVYDGKWNSKNRCGLSLAVVLAVNFGGSIWRAAWRPPPRAERARKNGIFLSFLSKIGAIFVIFSEN